MGVGRYGDDAELNVLRCCVDILGQGQTVSSA